MTIPHTFSHQNENHIACPHHKEVFQCKKMADWEVLLYNFLLRRKFLHWIFPWLKRAYGDACVVTSSVRQWVKHFKGGNTDLNNQACSGHAQTALFWVTTQRVVVISDISGQPIGPILRVHESKRKPVAPNKVYAGKSMDSEKHQ